MTWPYTMTTPYWSDFVPTSTFNRNLSGFHRTFPTGVACRQGTLTPPDTWSRPFGTCICSTCWNRSFSELIVILPDYALRISLGTFSILHSTTFQLYMWRHIDIQADWRISWNICFVSFNTMFCTNHVGFKSIPKTFTNVTDKTVYDTNAISSQ